MHLPQFVYTTPIAPQAAQADASSSSEQGSRPFSFSAFFQSSTMSAPDIEPEPAPTISAPPSAQKEKAGRSILREPASAAFIGFSWGPARDAFPDSVDGPKRRKAPHSTATPTVLKTPCPLQESTPVSVRVQPRMQSTPQQQTASLPFTSSLPFMTPVRQTSAGFDHMNTAGAATPFRTPYRPPGGTAPRRTVSDREAMKQLVDCVGMSVRKRVLESGRKPRFVQAHPDPRGQPPSTLRSRGSAGTGSAGPGMGTLKALRFDRSVVVVADSGAEYRIDAGSTSASASESAMGSVLGLSVPSVSASGSASHLASFVSGAGSASSASLAAGGSGLLGLAELGGRVVDEFDFGRGWDEGSSAATEMSYSPTPRPRPGSVARSRSGSGSGSWSWGVAGSTSLGVVGGLAAGGSLSRTPSTSSVGSMLARVNAGVEAGRSAKEGDKGKAKETEDHGQVASRNQIKTDRASKPLARERNVLIGANTGTSTSNLKGKERLAVKPPSLRPPPSAPVAAQDTDDTNVFSDGTLPSSHDPLTLADDVLERMELRHQQMMEELSAIGAQLDAISGRVSSGRRT